MSKLLINSLATELLKKLALKSLFFMIKLKDNPSTTTILCIVFSRFLSFDMLLNSALFLEVMSIGSLGLFSEAFDFLMS